MLALKQKTASKNYKRIVRPAYVNLPKIRSSPSRPTSAKNKSGECPKCKRMMPKSNNS